MKLLYISLAALFLAGCQSTQTVVTTKYQVVIPDASMYRCEVLKNYPDYNKLTDAQVARVMVALYKNNVQCKNSIEAIRKYLEEAKKTIEQ